jgi:excinuclease ABC subunit C
MKGYVQALAFEKAEGVKKKIGFLENYQSGSVVANSKAGNLDVFTLQKEKNTAYINYLMVRNGAIIQTHTNKAETHLDETPEEILLFCGADVPHSTAMQERSSFHLLLIIRNRM